MYNLAQTIISAFRSNNEGSSKRIAAGWILIFTGLLDLGYLFAFVYSSLLSNEEITTIHEMVVGDWEYTLSANFIAIASYLGITYFDKKLDTKKEVEIKKVENNTEK